MNMVAAGCLCCCMLFHHALAQVPETGRYQELSFSAEEVGAHMEDRYIEQVAGLAAAGKLDTDLSLQLRLARLSSLQESEADQLGMLLAHRAGWRADDMVSFYRKLAASDSAAPLLPGAYPAAASRVSMARGMRRLLEGGR